jgi:hypothetical protein
LKNIIVTIAEILLGIALFVLIFSGSSSLTEKSKGIFESVANKIDAQVDDQVNSLNPDLANPTMGN